MFYTRTPCEDGRKYKSIKNVPQTSELMEDQSLVHTIDLRQEAEGVVPSAETGSAKAVTKDS